MGWQNITCDNTGAQCVPGETIPWDTWVSASRTRNYCEQDPLLDWLEAFSEVKGFHPDPVDERTDFLTFIFRKGNEFESTVLTHLRTLAPITVIASDHQRIRTLQGAEATWEAMAQGAELIAQAVLWNPQNQTYGAADLLIRSDVLARLFPNAITETDAHRPAPDLPNARWHYRVIDIKYTTLDLLKDGHASTDALAYLVQVWLYNEALGRLQGYTPPAGYLLGRSWKQGESEGTGAMERLARVDREFTVKPWDGKPLSQIAQDACQWIRRVRREGSVWKVLPTPSAEALRPNMKYKEDQPWHTAKCQIAEALKELTALPYVSPKHRASAARQGITAWTDPKCEAATLQVNGATYGPRLDRVLEANRSPHDGPIVFPARITANGSSWRASVPLECFVDFETVSDLEDDFTGFPQRGGQPLIFMIGCGFNAGTVEQPRWEFAQFTAQTLTPQEEIRIIDAWVAHLKSLAAAKGIDLTADAVRLFHWSPAEVNFLDKPYTRARERYGKSTDWPDLPWVDLLKNVVREEPVTVRGAFNFGLKAVAKAMHQHQLIETSWTDGPTDGLGAMVGAWSCQAEAQQHGVPMTSLPLMHEIARYNEVDCKVMMEVLNYFRTRR